MRHLPSRSPLLCCCCSKGVRTREPAHGFSLPAPKFGWRQRKSTRRDAAMNLDRPPHATSAIVAAAAPAAGSTIVPCVAPVVVASGAGSSSGCVAPTIVALGSGSSGSDSKARHRPPHPPIKRTTTKPKSRLAIAGAPSAPTTPSAPATPEASSSGGGLQLLKSMGFVTALQPLFKMVTRNTIRKDIMDAYMKEKKKALAYMAGTKSIVAITTDLWTSENQKRGYMAITAHFIDDSWTLRNIIMRFIYVPATHTAEVICE